MRLALCLLISLTGQSVSVFADSANTIGDLFRQFDALDANHSGEQPGGGTISPPGPTCSLSFSATQAAIDALVRNQKPIEQKLEMLDASYRAIIEKMPRLGARKSACNARIRREIDAFAADLDALELARLARETEEITSCVINFRQRMERQEAELNALPTEEIITTKLKFNKEKKAVTDLDFKRNEFAVFLDQVDGYLTRRKFEIEQSKQINCEEGDVF